MDHPAPPSLLTLMIAGFLRELASWGLCGKLPMPVVSVIAARMQEMRGRMDALLQRFRAGHKMRRAASTPAVTAAAGAVRKVPKASFRLPRKTSWLRPIMQHEAGAFRSQLELVLTDPEMVALMQATAQAARMLKPYCRMLGVDAGFLHWPADCQPPPPKPRERRPRKKRAPSPQHRARDDFYSITSPLQQSAAYPRPMGRRWPLRCFNPDYPNYKE
jgi:hypothetical protein